MNIHKTMWKYGVLLGAIIGLSLAAFLSPTLAEEEKPIVTSSGLQYLDLVKGEGREAHVGETASVHYTGWLKDGTKFDSSVDRGQPFSFRLGAGRVIKGWDEGVVGMNIGSKRKLIIPPQSRIWYSGCWTRDSSQRDVNL